MLLSLLCFWLICAFWKNLISRTPPTTIGDRDGRQISRERRESCGAQKTKKGKKQKKKKEKRDEDFPALKNSSLLLNLYVIYFTYSRRARKAQTNVFFLLISHSSPTRPPSVCLCERERGFLDTWSTKARALEEYTKRLYLNKNLEKKAKAD